MCCVLGAVFAVVRSPHDQHGRHGSGGTRHGASPAQPAPVPSPAGVRATRHPAARMVPDSALVPLVPSRHPTMEPSLIDYFGKRSLELSLDDWDSFCQMERRWDKFRSPTATKLAHLERARLTSGEYNLFERPIYTELKTLRWPRGPPNGAIDTRAILNFYYQQIWVQTPHWTPPPGHHELHRPLTKPSNSTLAQLQQNLLAKSQSNQAAMMERSRQASLEQQRMYQQSGQQSGSKPPQMQPNWPPKGHVVPQSRPVNYSDRSNQFHSAPMMGPSGNMPSEIPRPGVVQPNWSSPKVNGNASAMPSGMRAPPANMYPVPQSNAMSGPHPSESPRPPMSSMQTPNWPQPSRTPIPTRTHSYADPRAQYQSYPNPNQASHMEPSSHTTASSWNPKVGPPVQSQMNGDTPNGPTGRWSQPNGVPTPMDIEQAQGSSMPNSPAVEDQPMSPKPDLDPNQFELVRAPDGLYYCPFSCRPKGFKDRSQLRKHIRTHSAQRLPCPHCHLQFRYQSTLEVHQKTKHADLMQQPPQQQQSMPPSPAPVQQV